MKPSTLRELEIAWRVHVQPRWGASVLALQRMLSEAGKASILTLGVYVNLLNSDLTGCRPPSRPPGIGSGQLPGQELSPWAQADTHASP